MCTGVEVPWRKGEFNGIHLGASFWGRTHKKVIHFFTEAGDSVITAAAEAAEAAAQKGGQKQTILGGKRRRRDAQNDPVELN